MLVIPWCLGYPDTPTRPPGGGHGPGGPGAAWPGLAWRGLARPGTALAAAALVAAAAAADRQRLLLVVGPPSS